MVFVFIGLLVTARITNPRYRVNLNFQNYVNTVLEVLHEYKRVVQNVQCIDMDNLIIIYTETI